MLGWQAATVIGRIHERNKDWRSAARVYEKFSALNKNRNAELLYRLGNVKFLAGDLDAAKESISTALDLDPNQATWRYRLGFILERQKDYPNAITNYTSALDRQPNKAEWNYRLSTSLKATGDTLGAIDALKRALQVDPTNVKFHERLTAILSQSAPAWQQLEAAESYVRAAPRSSEARKHLATCLAAMNRFDEALTTYQVAKTLGNFDANTSYAAGVVAECAGKTNDADEFYAEAIQNDEKLRSNEYGIGAFHQRFEDWDRAAAAYKKSIEINPNDAELHFRLGFSLERCYNWTAAKENYLLALGLRPGWAYCQFRVGFTLERMGSFEDAANWYRLALLASTSANKDWFYRLGYVLRKLSRFQEAGMAFNESSANPSFEASISLRTAVARAAPKLWSEEMSLAPVESLSPLTTTAEIVTLAKCAESAEDWGLAAQLYEQLTLRSTTHQSTHFDMLAHALYMTGEFEQSATASMHREIFCAPHGVDTSEYKKNAGLRQVLEYTEFYENLSLRDDFIMYESNLGDSIDCNPLEIYRSIISDSKYEGYTHFWSVNANTLIPDEILSLNNVILVRKGSNQYRRILSTAKYLINNSTFPPYFIRKNGQKFLNTWHGTPLKAMGTDVKESTLGHSNVARNFLQATHLVMPNEHTRKTLVERFDLDGLVTAKIALTGYPRNDALSKPDTTSLETVRRMLGISENDKRKIVLYAPTWRGTMNARDLDVSELKLDLERMNSSDLIVLYRGHHYTEKLLEGTDVPAILVPRSIPTNDLLPLVDILVTDYSSIFFDFLASRRPIVFYTPDLHEYTSERGLYFDMNEMPGQLCLSRNELKAELQKLTAEEFKPNSKYISAVENFSPMDDGQSTKRTIAFFFDEAEVDLVNVNTDDRSTVLFRQSLIPNGLTSSFINLLNEIDTTKYRPVLVTDAASLENDPARLSQYSRLPVWCQVLGRTGRQVLRPEEKWLIDTFTVRNRLTTPEQYDIYFHAFKRESRRLFGEMPLLASIEFDGYSPFMASLMAMSGQEDTHSSVYLHSDMTAEKHVRFPFLEGMFKLYNSFDSVCSVSATLNDINRDLLATRNDIDLSKFDFVPNAISPDAIVKRAKEVLDDDLNEWFNNGDIKFVTVGRLSPEKDQAKLVRAFIQNSNGAANTRLLIVGDGPLRDELKTLIDGANLGDRIRLAGQRSNPYSIMSRSDCFVLSSLHEGQPMVLLEALTLGVPVIATNIPGAVGVLGDSFGSLVPNSVEGLQLGMSDFIKHSQKSNVFNASEYLSSAMLRFDEIALNAGR